MLIAIELELLEQLLSDFNAVTNAEHRMHSAFPAYWKAKKVVNNYKLKIAKAKDPKHEN